MTGRPENGEWRTLGPVLKIRIGHLPGDPSLILRLRGEIDVGTAPALTQTFIGLVGSGTAAQITIDLVDVDFCDVAGVRALVSMRIHANTCGIGCHVINPRPHIAWLIGLADAAGLLERPQ